MSTSTDARASGVPAMFLNTRVYSASVRKPCACSARACAERKLPATVDEPHSANTDPTNGPRGAGYYYDRYAVTLAAGQVINVTQTANTGFTDTFLYLYGSASCGVLAQDDDSAGNLNSRIIFTAPAAGTFGKQQQ